MKERDLQKDFGISLKQYYTVLANQNGVCAICKKPESHIRLGKLTQLRVDRNHKSEKVRGLLCNSCNIGIGFLQDSPELLITAAQYLKSFE